jgi:hypothetical protein
VPCCAAEQQMTKSVAGFSTHATSIPKFLTTERNPYLMAHRSECILRLGDNNVPSNTAPFVSCYLYSPNMLNIFPMIQYGAVNEKLA